MNKNGMTTEAGTPSRAIDEKIDSIKETVRGYVDQGAQKMGELKSKVVEVKDQAVDRGGDVVGQVTELIKAHPLKAVGIAFGLGYIGMRLFRR